MNKYTTVSDAGRKALISVVEMHSIKRGTVLLGQGQYCDKLYFINSGMLRTYYLEDGNEVTKWIFIEGELLTSLNSYFSGNPSDDYIEACEDSEIITLSRKSSELLKPYPEFEIFGSMIIQDKISCLDKISKQLTRQNAAEKYSTLLKYAPDMLRRAKLQHIASILNITPETLSRVRATK